jgi:predicted Zn finger-like uncharacterized protein
MPVLVECPSCETQLKTAEDKRGKKIRCPKCQQVFQVPLGTSAPKKSRPRDDDDEEPAPALPSRESRPADDDETGFSERRVPSRRSRDDDEDDDRDMPRRARPVRRRDDDDDDYYDDERPRSRQKKGSALPWILAGSLGGVLVLGGLVAVILVMRKPADNAQANRPAAAVQPVVAPAQQPNAPVGVQPAQPQPAQPAPAQPPDAAPDPDGTLQGDLAALAGLWVSGPVPGAGGQGTGTVKLRLTQAGKGNLEVLTRQGGRSSSSTRSFTFRLEQQGDTRAIVAPGPLGAGLNLSYRLEGGQLILTGTVTSRRISYNLQNVALRRTADAAAAPGGPAGKPPFGDSDPRAKTPIKITGDLFTFVQEAITAGRLSNVDIQGFKVGNNTYRDIPERGGVLIGFEIGLGKFVNNAVINALRPIYLTRDGERPGRWYGTPPDNPIVIKAKAGYAVGSISIRTALNIDGMSLTYVKLGKDRLEVKDAYKSEWVGGQGGSPQVIGTVGALFVGICGHRNNEGMPVSLGLVAVLGKE